MNFYKHHIGDYAQATSHLSFVEDAAYSRLIRKYYAEEKPLPKEIKLSQRLVGARTKEEKQAVEDMLNEFFILEDDGWHNKRCDEELARANAQAETNKRIAEDRENRKKALKELSTNRTSNENESLNESTTNRQPSQTPDTRHQTPDSNIKTIAEEVDTSQAEKPPPPPQIDYSKNKPFSMHGDWEPSPSFDSLAKIAGLLLGEDTPVSSLREFKTYWITHPEKQRTQGEWEHAFIKSLKAEKLKGGKK